MLWLWTCFVTVAVGVLQGGPCEPPEGLETLGCPVYSHPAQLTDNRNVSDTSTLQVDTVLA